MLSVISWCSVPVLICLILLTGLSGLSRFITMDSTISAADFISTLLFNKPLSLWQEIPLSSRYLLYTLLMGVEVLSYVFLAGHYHTAVFWLLYLLSLPPVAHYVVTTPWFAFHRIQKRVFGYLWKQTKRVLCLIFAAIINLICEITLDVNPAISRKEIADTFVEADYNSVSLFIRIFVFTNIVATFESKGLPGNAMKGFLRTMFNAGQVLEVKSAYTDPYPRIAEPADKIRAILTSRQLKQFYNPYVLSLLLQLYESSGDSRLSLLIKRKMMYLTDLTTRFCTIYTIATVTSSWYVVGISTFVVLFYTLRSGKCDGIPTPLLYHVGVRLAGVLLMFLLGTPVLAAGVCEYGELLYNKGVLFTLRSLGRKVHKYGRLCYAHRDIAPDLAVTIVGLVLLRYLLDRTVLFYGLIVFGLVLSRHPYLLAALALSGLFSDYAWWHLSAVATLLYVGYSLRDVDEFPEEYIEPSMIASYIQPPVVRIHAPLEIIESPKVEVPPPPTRPPPPPPGRRFRCYTEPLGPPMGTISGSPVYTNYEPTSLLYRSMTNDVMITESWHP